MRISDWSSDVCSSDLRLRHTVGNIEIEAGILAHFLDRMPGMNARQSEAAFRLVEGHDAAPRHQRVRSTRPVHVVVADAGRADEIDLRHENTRGMLLPEQDDALYDEI